MEKKKKLSLPVQIFIALVLGIVVGLMFYFTGAAGFTTSYIKPFGDIFVNLLKFIVVPVVLLFGMYVIMNGHISPGGGFSGGAILAAGLMLFAMVWGDAAASAVLRPRRLQTVVLCSLGFYCLAKSYSFYTGANHLHSVISPGTPGRILSAGLILPLNVAVGFVVCCTMYSLYMYFRRGEL